MQGSGANFDKRNQSTAPVRTGSVNISRLYLVNMQISIQQGWACSFKVYLYRGLSITNHFDVSQRQIFLFHFSKLCIIVGGILYSKPIRHPNERRKKTIANRTLSLLCAVLPSYYVPTNRPSTLDWVRGNNIYFDLLHCE